MKEEGKPIGKKKVYRQQMAVAMSAALVFSPFSSSIIGANQASAEDSPEVSSMQEETAETAEEKVDEDVVAAFEDDEYVDVLIEMSEQVDTAEAAEQGVQSMADTESAYQQKMAARYGVFNELRNTAEQTQAGTLDVLERSEGEGDVQDFQSYYIMNVVYAEVNEEVLEELAYRPEIERIKIDEFIERELPDPSDMTIAAEDGVEWNIDRVNAPDVWDELGIEGDGVTVGVIDSGADWEHEALQEQWRGFDSDDPDDSDPYGNWFDAVEGQDMPYDMDAQPHGTHVLGTIVGQDPDEENLIGVAPEAEWIAARAFTILGGAESDLLASGEYMLAPEDDPSLAPDIVNNSWGGAPGVDEWYQPMVEAWRDAGQVPVFSAGNDGPGEETVTPPANYPESYAVAAVDNEDQVADFSSRGPSQYDDDLKPNISAPGVNIRSSVPGGYEDTWSGTSMAAPHVAGTAALLLSTDLGLSVDGVEDIMNDTAEPLTDDEYTDVPNDAYGLGMVDAYEAVASIAGDMGEVEGEVLQEGTDTDAPVIDHEPLDEVFAGDEVPVTATIEDDVSVVDADLWITNEDLDQYIVTPMELVAGDHEEGEYEGAVPPEYVEDPSFDYFIQARDYGGNITQTDEYTVDVEFGVIPDDYEEDFSSEPTGWTFDGDWEWGEPEVGPDPVVGDQLVGTNLEGSYGDDENILMFPPLDLRESGDEASLRLNHWHDFEQGDIGEVLISSDYGENWESVHEVTGTTGEWESLYVDLEDYTNADAPILVSFVLDGEGNQADGWYVDNVQLVGGDDTAPAEPENLEAETSVAGVHLSWDEPVDEDLDLAGYDIYRSQTEGGDYEHIDSTESSGYQDMDVEVDEEYFYVVSAYDYSGNESDVSNEVSVIAPEVDAIYYSDFDADDGGFTVGGDPDGTFEWGEPTSGPNEAFVGTNLWATDLAGEFSANEQTYIESPELDLTDVSDAELHYALWYELNTDWSYGYVEVTTDGGDTWEEIAEYTGDEDPQWNEEELSLSEYTGETIQVRFFLDGSAVPRAGLYVDDVLVVGTSDDVEHSVTNDPIETPKDDIERDADLEKELEEERTTDIDLSTLQEEDGYEYESVDAADVVEEDTGLPVDGTVTVLETDRTTNTDPVTGQYNLMHTASEDGETFTLEADAYGFYPETQEVMIEEDETTEANFMLEEIPSGEIAGSVVDERSGETIEGASIRVVEDPQVDEVTSDENGEFLLEDVLEGEYTLMVSAPDYHGQEVTEVEVEGDEVTDLTIELSPFIGYEDEIAYDTGDAENAVVLNEAGDGMAVQFTPEDTAVVNGVNMYIWDEEFPVPGGDVTAIAVYDTDEDGNPTEQVIEPFEVEVERDGWNYIDLSDHGFVTDDDFYITTVQTYIGDESPAVGTDESQDENAERSYLYVDGSFQEETEYGNFMMRADVSYALEEPVIEEPEDMTYTNEDAVEVSGMINADSEIILYNNDEEVARTETEDEAFAADVPLSDGENVIEARAEVEDGLSDPSAPVTVIQDTDAPDLTIDAPEDGSHTNRDAITVEGDAQDEYLDQVTVNGEEAGVDEDGTFSHRMLVDEGENEMTVVAEDLAGNSTEETITVHAQFEAADIENVLPDEDVYLNAGESVAIEFESDPGLDATFTVHMPLTNATDNVIELPMTEEDDGHYVGHWTAISGLVAEGAVIEVNASDEYGNDASAYAEGELYINTEDDPGDPGEPGEPGEPTAQFEAPEAAVLGQGVAFDASQSEADGEIVEYAWNFGDGQTAEGEQVEHEFAKPGNREVTLTITDEHGDTDTVSDRVHVRPANAMPGPPGGPPGLGIGGP